MQSSIKNSLIPVCGLMMGVALAIVGCGGKPVATQVTIRTVMASATAMPVLTQTNGAVVVSTETATVQASATLQMTALPEITPQAPYAGPLSSEEQQRLEMSAQQYLAGNTQQAYAVAKEIGEEEPATLDGPLVVAVLHAANLLDKPVGTHPLWLVDPLKDWQKTRKVFAPEVFEQIRWKIQDGTKLPVFYAGDVLYLVPLGSNGTGRFLLVSWVDGQGRVWGLRTNETGPGNYTIQQSLLIDMGEGAGTEMGKSGLAGLAEVEIWRRRDRRTQTVFEQSLNTVLDRGGNWFVVVKPVGEADTFERQADVELHPASVIKVAVAMLVMQDLVAQGSDLTQALQGGPAGAGRSFEQLLHASLVNSEEDATGKLEQYVLGTIGPVKIHAELSAWGARKTSILPRKSTAQDMTALLEGLYQKRLISPEASQILLGYLAEVTQGDTARLWKLKSVLPLGSEIYNKRGTLTDPVLIVADAGIIVLPDGTATVVSVFGYPDGYETYEDLDAIIGDFALAWYRSRSN